MLKHNDEAINDTVWARTYKRLMTLRALVIHVSVDVRARRKRKYRLVSYQWQPNGQLNLSNKLISKDFMQVSRNNRF